MNARLKPIASKHENGRIAVYVGATYSYLPRESALSLFQQLGMALDLPYSEGVALFAAMVLHAHRGDAPGEQGDVDGGSLEEFALECELLESFDVPADGCGEGCMCDQGDRCHRTTPLGAELIKLIEAEPTPLRELRL